MSGHPLLTRYNAISKPRAAALPGIAWRGLGRSLARRYSVARPVVAWIAGAGGLLAYNWWVLVPFKPGLLRSPDEFFSNLEVAGHPYATVMRQADMLAGLLLFIAFAVAGFAVAGTAVAGGVAAGRRATWGGRWEWLGMMIFSVVGGVGGLFPQVCTDGIRATCLSREWRFELPATQYVHDGAGIIEFTAITLTLGHA